MNEQQIEQIVASVLAELHAPPLPPASYPLIPIEPSAKHVHLTAEALEKLFGPGAALTQTRALSQPGEFLSGQRVHIVTEKGVLKHVAVLGPVRNAVQAELSLTDCHALGIDAPVRLSGDLQSAADVVLVGPAGVLEARGAAIVAQRHIHMTPQDAARFCVSDGQTVSVRVQSARPLTFGQVAVRVSEHFALAMHIDFDEANACGLEAGSVGEMYNVQCTMHNEIPPVPMIAEKVITEALAKALAKAHEKITVRKGTIITPSARDVFSQHRILVEYR